MLHLSFVFCDPKELKIIQKLYGNTERWILLILLHLKLYLLRISKHLSVLQLLSKIFTFDISCSFRVGPIFNTLIKSQVQAIANHYQRSLDICTIICFTGFDGNIIVSATYNFNVKNDNVIIMFQLMVANSQNNFNKWTESIIWQNKALE